MRPDATKPKRRSVAGRNEYAWSHQYVVIVSSENSVNDETGATDRAAVLMTGARLDLIMDHFNEI